MSTMSIQEANRILTAPGAPFEIEERVIRGVATQTWKNAPPSLRAVFEESRVHGDRCYLVYEDQRLSYRETHRAVATLARSLVRQYRVQPGERVAIAMRNYPEWAIAFWAAASVGAVVVPLNAWWKGAELEYGLSDSGSCLLFADAERARLLAPHLPSLALREVIVAHAGDELASGQRRFEELLDGSDRDASLPEVAIDPEDHATIFYTSGTTGKPKGALGTHRNICTNLGCIGFVQARAALRLGTDLSAPPGEQNATLLSVPFFHVTGCHSVLVGNTAAGNKLVMMHKWNPERALELIERERITQFGGVPSMVWQVLESLDFHKRDTSSVKSVAYGGAPASPELVKRIREEFPEVTPGNGYGLTETSAITTYNAAQDYLLKPGSVGPPVPVCEVSVMNEAGEPLPAGEVGELWIKGPNVVVGYWNKPEATEATFSDGWLRSGDLAYLDEEGFVYLVDRAKDMLIRGGENVYCVEVEDALYTHPAVMDAAVVGLPHRVLGEEVGAAVQLKPGSRITEDELKQHVAARLAGFKVPVRIDLRDDPLPRNPNGKILKSRIREELSG
jgi:long-chain acyl-CoA synthetase